MKRIGRIGMVLAVCAVLGVVVLAFISIFMGPPLGHVFSTINNSLNTTRYYGSGDSPSAPQPGSYDNQESLVVQNVPMTGGDGYAAQDNLGSNPAEPKRLVIKNADLTIVVTDPAAKMQAISTMAENIGGFVVSSSMGQTYLSDGTTKVPEGSIVVRIPAEKLDDALKEIKSDAVDVRNESQTGQDVTKEYTDLSSQLKNLQATEQKLTEIMDKATKTDDVLAVFNQLTQIRGQIEVIIGQMKYYEESAAMSAVSVRLIADKSVQPIEIAGWQPQGEARDAIQALVKFFQGFVNFLIWLVLFFIPVAVVILVLLALLWRFGKLLWKKFFPKKPEATE